MRGADLALIPISSDERKPSIGCKYLHFTEQELKWVCNRNGRIFHRRNKALKKFIRQFPDLKILEREIAYGKILDEKLKNSFIDWYVICLIAFRRISVSIEVYYKLNLLAIELAFPESPVCDVNFIENFTKNAIDMGYSKVSLKSVFTDLIWMFVHFGGSEEVLANKISEYEEIIQEKVPKRKSNIHVISNILHNMGYTNIDNNVNAVKKTNPDDFILALPEIGKAFSQYCTFLNEKKSHKTAKTIISHVRSFLNYLVEKHYEVKALKDISNATIIGFREFEISRINMFGRKNSNATINHRLQAINDFWGYLINTLKFNLSREIITEFDFLKEPKTFPKKILKSEIMKLVFAIRNETNEEYLQQKIILIILILTGRRIHEVLTLELNCIKRYNGKMRLFLHKTKKNKATFEFINDECTAAIIKAREYAKGIKQPIYSKLDNRSCRRLFPSSHYKGRSLVSYNSVEAYFKKIQMDNGIIDENRKAKYTLHDNKRNFISNMLSAGITPQEISNFLDQQIFSLQHYESYNEHALDVLRIVEKKRLLLGETFAPSESLNVKEENEDKKKILDILNNIDVINRNKENLIYAIKNPKMALPLSFAMCTDNSSVGICGEILCLSCYEVHPTDFESIDKFAIKMYKHIYKFKRVIDFKRLESEIVKAITNGYRKLGIDNETYIQAKIKELKGIARKEVKNSG